MTMINGNTQAFIDQDIIVDLKELELDIDILVQTMQIFALPSRC